MKYLLRLAALAAFCLPLGLNAVHAQKPRDILEFGRFSEIQVSPDGAYLAAKYQSEGGTTKLLVRDLTKHISAFVSPRDFSQGEWGAKNVVEFAWVNNSYLAVVAQWSDQASSLHYVNAQDLRTNDPVPILDEKATYRIVDAIPGSSEYIVTRGPLKGKPGTYTVLKLDIESRLKSDTLYETEAHQFEAIADRQHQLRMAKIKKSESESAAWHLRNPDTNEWKPIKLDPWSPLVGFDADPNKLLVRRGFSNTPGGIYFYDLPSEKFSQELVTHPTQAFHKIATPLYDNKRNALVGVHIDAVESRTQWAHPAFQNIQKNINAACTGSNNRIVAWNDALNRIVVERIYSDKPADFYTFDFANAKMDYLFTNGADLKKQTGARRDQLGIKNRDGLELDALFTRPKKSKSEPPLVVIVRNDPFGTIDRIEWKSDDQFYASLGYAVLRLNFSGSGDQAGPLALNWKKPESPLKPIQDLEDALKWIANEKLADTERAAIIGYGVGGWIAAHSTIASPGLFKCAVSCGGVYDLIEYQNRDTKSPISSAGYHVFAEPSMGLPAATLAELSPMRNLPKITASLLVAYGQWDQEGYAEHVKDFAAKAKEAGIDIEKPYRGGWWGGQIGSIKAFQEYNEAIAEFLKKRLK